jgi:hypothetical protein
LDSCFQFPLLGIFPCTDLQNRIEKLEGKILSIPSTWDFSMHPTSFLAWFADSGFSQHDVRYVLSIIIEM